MTMLFDPKTVAMKVEFAKNVKREIDNAYIGYGGVSIITKPGAKETQKPMYFDNNGYVYVAGKKQKKYIKVSFEKLAKMMKKVPDFLSGGVALPGPDVPDSSVTYYGMDVSPKKFPILEWVFVYKTEFFEGNPDFSKEIINCTGNENCIVYTLKAGKDSGSYVLFDSKKRLREIFTINSGFIDYTYVEVTVELPDADDMSGYF